MSRIYVASSWRCSYQPRVVEMLREDGHGAEKAPSGVEPLLHSSGIEHTKPLQIAVNETEAT